MLHPVTWPNHGPQIELYLAEEAIGLVRSLDWNVEKGPLWKEEDETDVENEEALTDYDQFDSDRETYTMRKKKQRLSHSLNYKDLKREKIKDGDYVYGPDVKGVYYKNGIIMEFDGDEEIDMQDEWKNELIRESMAKSSLIKVRKIHSGTFFTKGKLNELGYFLKENDHINVVYVNSQLTSLQQKKLEKRFNDIIQNREDRLRKYYLKSAQREKFEPTDIESESSQLSDIDQNYQGNLSDTRKIRVVDRFSIILQIFASRAKTRMGQLQIELAWLKYARTMLVRGGAPTFGALGNIFQGNMMRLDFNEVEIKSAKGSKSGSGTGFTGGGGETQLELERRKITDKESKIQKELNEINKRSLREKEKKENMHSTLPMIALVGYTNAGKTALLNLCSGASLESEDLLFQTLNTSQRRFRMPNGMMGVMLDTVGFITNLPHGLVQSFKATLEEIHFADVIVHVRDISHPQTNFQRDTVIKVMKEIGIPDEVFEKKYIEVWNKIDLLPDQEDFQQEFKQEQMDMQQKNPVVMMSCLEGTQKDEFLEEVSNLSQQLMGKQKYTLSYNYTDHDKRYSWLLREANVSHSDNFEFDEETGDISVSLIMDSVVYERYIKEFEKDQFQVRRDEKKRNKLAPPPGWNA